MNIKELRDKNISELEQELKSKKEELFNLRFQHAINQLDNPMSIHTVKKDIARIMTLIREKQLSDAQ